jgi:hypothetical protein
MTRIESGVTISKGLFTLYLNVKKVPKNFVICHHDYRLDDERYFLGGKFQNSKLFCHFYYTERLP